MGTVIQFPKKEEDVNDIFARATNHVGILATDGADELAVTLDVEDVDVAIRMLDQARGILIAMKPTGANDT